MSKYYSLKRSADWNYGGKKFRLSRSKIGLFLECKRCFYIDNKLGVARPKGFPFNLNSAVDHLLKKEFDIHRLAKSAHPLMLKYKLSAIPFADKRMDTWREVFEGIEYNHSKTGFTVSGAIDDVWVNEKGELIIVDYKSTSKDEDVNLDADWQDGYKRQMEIYQWLFRKNGFKVSDTGYFVYANGKKDRKAFDAKLEFDVTLIPYTGKADWVDGTLDEIKKCLESNIVPEENLDCDYCRYLHAVKDVTDKKIISQHVAHSSHTSHAKKIDPKEKPTLF